MKNLLLSFIMFVIGFFVVYYTTVTILGGITAIAMWDFSFMRELFILGEPSAKVVIVIRMFGLAFGFSAGVASAHSTWEELND